MNSDIGPQYDIQHGDLNIHVGIQLAFLTLTFGIIVSSTEQLTYSFN